MYLEKTRLTKECAKFEDALEKFVDHMNACADRLDDAKLAFAKKFGRLDTFDLSFPEDMDAYADACDDVAKQLNAMGVDQIGMRRHRVWEVLAGKFKFYA